MENSVSRDTQSALSSDRSLFANRSKKKDFRKDSRKGIQFRENVVADIKMNYGDNGKRQWKEDMSTIEREDHTNWFFSNLSENNVTFDNSCLVLSSRREEGDDKKRSWESMRRKRRERMARVELLYLSIRDSRSSSLKLPGLLGIAIAYYIHVLYGGQWCSTRDSLLFLSLSFFRSLPFPIVRDEKLLLKWNTKS